MNITDLKVDMLYLEHRRINVSIININNSNSYEDIYIAFDIVELYVLTCIHAVENTLPPERYPSARGVMLTSPRGVSVLAVIYTMKIFRKLQPVTL